MVILLFYWKNCYVQVICYHIAKTSYEMASNQTLVFKIKFCGKGSVLRVAVQYHRLRLPGPQTRATSPQSETLAAVSNPQAVPGFST